MHFRSRRAAFFAGTSLAMLAALPALADSTVSTMGAWNGTSFISSYGVPNTATYGQTITPNANQTTLKNFTFQLSQTAGTPPNYQAYVYAWDSVTNRITGSALYTSAVMTSPSGAAYQAVSINTGSTTLSPGQQYVLFLTTSGLGSQLDGVYRYGALSNNTTYAGGQFVFNNNGESFSQLSSTAWSSIAQDLAFTMTFGPHNITTVDPYYLSSDLNVGTVSNFQGGTLRLDNSGTIADNFVVGAVAGNTIDANGKAVIFTGAFTGTGALAITSGISGGRVSINGNAGGTAFTVASGATLGGTGTVGATTIASGATLAPGNSIGTLNVNGNLTLASGSTYAVELSPTASDRTNVTGAASLNGGLTATFASGSYTPGRYTLINATGGVTGTFSSLSVTGQPNAFKTRLAYDANNAYLYLDPNALVPLLNGQGTTNQAVLAAAIDRAVAAGATQPGSFFPLYNLTGADLNTALSQLTGQIGPQASQAAAQTFLPFLQQMLDEAAAAANGGGMAANFAPNQGYASADAPNKAQLAPGDIKVWGAISGGHAGISADAAMGAQSMNANGYGFALGAQMGFADGLSAGGSIAAGKDTYRTGNGSGVNDNLTIGLNARQNVLDRGYVAAAMGYAWNQINTTRVVTISGTDVLQGNPDATSYGGRVEAGYSLSLDETYGITPFAAFAGQSFDTPSYSEFAVAGSNAFALSYASHSTMIGHTELGGRINTSFAFDGGVLKAEATLGWAHSLSDRVFGQAAFVNLAGSGFDVYGVTEAKDSALLGLKLQGESPSGLSYGVRLDSRVAGSSTIVTGTGNLGWHF